MKNEPTSPTAAVPGERRCPRCGALMGGFGPEGLCGACLFDSGLSADEPVAAFDLLASGPRRFGDYELIEEIGRGGMGVIFKARQLSLNRTLAVKMILSGALADARELQRFRAEAETAARLRHTNIVAIHEIGEREGQPFFSMDFVEGRNLAELSRNGPMPMRQAAGYVKTIAEAVEYAHAQGVLHRDLKPSNILIDANGQPHITDFGLAKRLTSTQDSGLKTQDLTLTGQVLGSPNFMPPEQASGARGNSGPASDVYSLGAILYQLVTGRPPFVAETVTQTLRLVAENEPVSPRLLNGGVSRDLETICLKCLQKEPARRYATAGELADDLGRLLRDEPIRARPAGQGEKFWRWCRRRPVVAGLGAAVIILLGVVAIVSAASAGRTRRDEARLREQLVKSLLTQARAENRSNIAGRRNSALAAIRQAAAIRPTLELRNEAIAALSRPDLRLTDEIWRPRAKDIESDFVIDPAARHYVYARSNRIFFERVADGGIEFTLDSPAGPPGRMAELSFGGGDDRWLRAITPKNTAVVWNLREHRVTWQFASQNGVRPYSRFLAGRDEVFFCPDKTHLLRVDLNSMNVSNVGAFPARITGFEVSPTGRHLAAQSGSNFWTSTFPITNWRKLPQPQPPILHRSFDRTGARLVCDLSDFSFWLWDLEKHEYVGGFAGHTDGIKGYSYDEQSRWMLSTSFDGTSRLSDLLAAQPEVTSPLAGSDVNWHPSRNKFSLRMYGTNGLRWFELERPISQTLVPRVADRMAVFSTLAINRSGRLILVGVSGQLKLLDAQTGKVLMGLKILQDGPLDAAFEPGDTGFICSAPGGVFRCPMRRLADGTLEIEAAKVIRPVGNCSSLTLDSTGDWIAVSSASGNIHLRNPGGDWRVIPKNARGLQLALSPDGRWLAGGAFAGDSLRVWDTSNGKLQREFPCSKGVMPGFTPAGELFAVTSTELVFWNLETGDRGKSLPRDYIGTLRGNAACSGDGQFMAFSRSRTKVDLLHLPTLEVLASFDQPNNESALLALDEHGTELIIGKKKEFLERWDLRRLRAELAGLNLDWQLPPLPPPDSAMTNSLRVEVQE